MVLSQILLFPVLVIAWSILGGASSYGVPHGIAPKGFHQPISSDLGTSVTKTTRSLYNADRTSSSDKSDNEEPSDYEIMSAIATSMAQWKKRQEQKKSRLHRRSVEENDEVCYEPFGCFNTTEHFDHLDLPQEPEEIGTRFTLHTRDLPEGEELNCFENASTEHRCKLNANLPIKLIIHGFASSANCAWIKTATKELLNVGDFNVIVVDWSRGAGPSNYPQAASNAQLVGRQVARLLEQLHVQMQVDYNQVHMIGFSLGAQIAGYAGLELEGLGRITGLDPAKPLFEGYHIDTRLDSTDAKFVDVIHTNGDNLPWGGLGIYEPLGHVDFYPNGGKHQPGCSSFIWGFFKYYLTGHWDALCNHRRAIDFFIDSIKPNCSFTAFPCDSFENFVEGKCFRCPPGGCPSMGFYADRTQNIHGNYFLVNTEDEPYCEYQKKIEVSGSQGKGPIRGYLNLVFRSQSRINETIRIEEFNISRWIEEGEQIQEIGITGKNFQAASEVGVLYSKSWYWGTDNCYLDKISIRDSSGNRYSYCGLGTEFKSGVMSTLRLTAGDCVP